MECSNDETEYSEIGEHVTEGENEWSNVVIVKNENLSWQENSSEVTINYADATEHPDQTITEHDGQIYISTNATDSLDNSIDPDKSEYYSILDTTYQAEDQDDENYHGNENVQIVVRVSEEEQILPDSEEQEAVPQDGLEQPDQDEDQGGTIENQVFLYRTEDSDEMYAVQIADDGNGNLQRYKYKVRQNEEGQLEAIPGTIEVQVDDMIEKHISECQNQAFLTQQVQEQDQGEKSELHQELLEDSQIHENLENQNYQHENQTQNEIVHQNLVMIKNEIQNDSVDNYKENYEEEHLKQLDGEIYANDDFNKEVDSAEENLQLEKNMKREHFEEQEEKMECETFETNFQEENLEPNYEETEHLEQENLIQNESESDEENYGTPEYLLSENEESMSSEPAVEQKQHDRQNDKEMMVQKMVTLDGAIINEGIDQIASNNIKIVHKEPSNNFSRSILNRTSLLAVEESTSEKKIVPKFFKSRIYNREFNKKIQHFDLIVEKENRSEGPSLKNSRSLLKNTVLSALDDKESYDTLNNIIENSSNNLGKKTTQIRIISAKNYRESFADNNENGEKKILEKSFRQPRKQKIKPVERADSEIIVQPVFYFDKPSTEIWSAKRKKFDENEIVKVSDSEDEITEVNSKSKKKKKIVKKPKKIEEITIIDSDSDHESVVEILTDNSQNEKHKNSKVTISKKSDLQEIENFDDITKIQEAVDNIVQERELREKQKEPTPKKVLNKNLKCPKCPKTFPREINLKNHMNIHNARLRQSLRGNNLKTTTQKKEIENSNIKDMVPKPDVSENISNLKSFYCARCKLKFLSEVQLKRHQTIHRDKKIPSLTPKKFTLRKSPLDPNKCKNIKKTPIDPKKSTKVLESKNVLSSPRRPFKCTECPMAFSQKVLLTSHKIRLHKKVLDSKKSVNTPESSRRSIKKIGLDVRRSVIPKKIIDRKSIIKKSPLKKLINNFPCKICSLKFRTLEMLKTHKKSSHVKTSTKTNSEIDSVKNNQKVVSKVLASKNVNTRSKRPHGGVPTSNRMQEAFEMMKKLKS